MATPYWILKNKPAPAVRIEGKIQSDRAVKWEGNAELEVSAKPRWSHPCCSSRPHQGTTVKNLQLSSYLPSPSLISTWVFFFSLTVNRVCLLSLAEGETRLFGSQQVWVVPNETPQRAEPSFDAPNKAKSWHLLRTAICSPRKVLCQTFLIYYIGLFSITTKEHRKFAINGAWLGRNRPARCLDVTTYGSVDFTWMSFSMKYGKSHLYSTSAALQSGILDQVWDRIMH